VDTIVRTTCPRDCYDACGMLVAVRDGAVRHVRGDPHHHLARGKLCRKCSIGYNGVWLDPDARLIHPLLRDGPKGSHAFRRTTWEEALRTTADRLTAIARDHGPASILNIHYTGTLGLVGTTFPQRLLQRIGATEVTPDTICNNAGHAALRYMYGTSEVGFDPRTRDDARCILVWGANPSACGPHQDEHWLREAAATVIVVDPVRTKTAAAADVHLMPRPGSDAALAFGMLHVIVRDALLDRAYIDANTVGFDELERLLDGCGPEWAARETGIAAAAIEDAARRYAAGPSLLWLGQGLQRQATGGNVFRAVAALPAVTGNLGRPGTGFCYLNGWGQVGIDDEALVPPGAGPAPEISHMELPDVLSDPARSRAVVVWNMNIASSAPRQRQVREALAREDLFCVVADVFPTDTVGYADVALPAASFLEQDDLVVPYFDLGLAAQVKAVEPPGDALPNSEIFRRLAAAMGYDDPVLFEPDRAIIDRVIAGTGLAADFATLAGAGTVLLPEVQHQFADGAFPTPSGKIEIASAAAEADGHPRVPQPTVDPPPPAGALRLLSPASEWTMNASFANEPKVIRKLGVATVTVHPHEAAARGLAEGAPVRLASAAGTLDLELALSDVVAPGVALVPKGRWGENVNVLVDAAASDMGESTSVHGTIVTLHAR
jgi:anaerobic selenocysteine-containing dehydrogenase